MKTFKLIRNEDLTGVSGTGEVAEGVIFYNGWVSMVWKTTINSLVFYPSIENVIKIHGHDGRTTIAYDNRDN